MQQKGRMTVAGSFQPWCKAWMRHYPCSAPEAGGPQLGLAQGLSCSALVTERRIHLIPADWSSPSSQHAPLPMPPVCNPAAIYPTLDVRSFPSLLLFPFDQVLLKQAGEAFFLLEKAICNRQVFAGSLLRSPAPCRAALSARPQRGCRSRRAGC